MPTGAGRSYPIHLPSNTSLQGARWFPRGDHILLTLQGAERLSCYMQDLKEGVPAGPPRQITNLNATCGVSSPDGHYLVRAPDEEVLKIYNLTDGTSRLLAGAAPGEKALSFSQDGKSIYVVSFEDSFVRAKLSRIDVSTGQRQSYGEITLSDLAGVPRIDTIFITPDGQQIAYAYHRVLNDLFVADVQ
jgi:Tol biopolymer transport system component